MYSNEDFENFYVRYKAEALPKGISLQSWYLKQRVSWNLFNKWYRDTRHRFVPVGVEGKPGAEEDEVSETISITRAEPSQPAAPAETEEKVRIMVDIRMTNGMQIRQKNLSFEKFRQLVEKLEGLC